MARFRQTVLFAVRETSDALLSPHIVRHRRVELEQQLEALVQYLEPADQYVAKRSVTLRQPRAEFRSSRSKLH
jgi:hypothetical protein